MILRNIVRRKGRTLMTVLALIVATALLLSMLSMAEGMQQNALKNIEGSKIDMIISAGALSTHGGFGTISKIPNGHELAANLSAREDVNMATPILNEWSGNLRLRANGRMIPVFAQGLVPKDAFALVTAEERARFPGYGYGGFSLPYDAYHNKTARWFGAVVIDSNTAGKFNIENGTKITFVTIDMEHEFTVVGVFDSELTGSGALKNVHVAVFHLSDLQRLLGYDDEDIVSEVWVNFISEVREDNKKVNSLKHEIEQEYPFYTVLVKEDFLEQVQQQVAISRGYYSAMGIIALVIGLLFVACVMIMGVYERTQEIGMLRAIGISKKSIFWMIFSESLLIVCVGAFLGLIPGYFGSLRLGVYISESYGLSEMMTAFTPTLIASSLLTITILGSLVSLYPAWKATRIEVITALRRT